MIAETILVVVYLLIGGVIYELLEDIIKSKEDVGEMPDHFAFIALWPLFIVLLITAVVARALYRGFSVIVFHLARCIMELFL